MAQTKLHKLLTEFAEIRDRDERMEFLIELAEKFEPVPESIAAHPYPESARVPGCQSEVFAFAVPNGNALTFHFAVENPQGISAKAMASILQESLSGAPLDEVLEVPGEIVHEIFGTSIGMGKGQGLRSMLYMIQALAKQALQRRALT